MPKYEGAAQVAVTIFEAWNAKDYDRGVSVLADDFEVIEVATGESFRGARGLLDEYRKWHAAVSDGWIDIKTVISSGGTVAMETVVRGTHDGAFPMPSGDIPPSGNKLEFEMCTISHVRDEKELVLERHYFDMDSMLRQLGAE